MTLARSIRVNVGAPFPALVKGDAGIAIRRKNGVWTIELGYMTVGLQNPPPASRYNTDYVLIYDSLAATYIRVPLAAIGGAARSQRAVNVAPVVINPTDQILSLNVSTPGTIQLPSASLRNGVPLTFKDLGRQAQNNPQTIATAAAEFIDGTATSVLLNTNGQAITLTPINDGVNAPGWMRT
jgi:hypothetical protein